MLRFQNQPIQVMACSRVVSGTTSDEVRQLLAKLSERDQKIMALTLKLEAPEGEGHGGT